VPVALHIVPKTRLKCDANLLNFQNCAISREKALKIEAERDNIFNKGEYSRQYELTYLAFRFMKLPAIRVVRQTRRKSRESPDERMGRQMTETHVGA
jgi:hypothetical protein